MRLACVLLLGIGLYGCSKSASVSPFDNPKTYFSTMTALSVDVFYETSAVPFTGTFSGAHANLNGRNFWDITEDNLKALFQGRPVTVAFTVPKATTSMTDIGAQGQTGWTISELIQLWERTRKEVSSATTGHLYLVFLRGKFEENGVLQDSILGVNITGTPVTAIFKDVVESTGASPTGPVPRFVEQSTVVHELAHALGLVNNGVAMISNHQDAAHGTHCTNTNCVMHYLNEGVSDAKAFAQTAIATGSLLLFKQECLDDTRGFTP